MMALLKSMPRDKFPTAVVACNTLMAEGATQAIMRWAEDSQRHLAGMLWVLSRSPVFRPRIVCVDQRPRRSGGWRPGTRRCERMRAAPTPRSSKSSRPVRRG